MTDIVQQEFLHSRDLSPQEWREADAWIRDNDNLRQDFKALWFNSTKGLRSLMASSDNSVVPTFVLPLQVWLSRNHPNSELVYFKMRWG